MIELSNFEWRVLRDVEQTDIRDMMPSAALYQALEVLKRNELVADHPDGSVAITDEGQALLLERQE